MMSEGLSVADAMALGNDGFGNGSWFWIVVLFLFGGFGGYGWGGRGDQYATQQQVQSGFESQNTFNTLQAIESSQAANAKENAILIKDAQYAGMQNTNTITSALNQGFNDVSSKLCCGFNGVDKSIMESTFTTTQAMNNGFNSVNHNLCEMSHQIADGICAIKTQLLQDKYDAAQNQLNLAQIASANSVQTNNILSAMGKWYANAPVIATPYYYGTAYSTTTF